MMKMRKSRFILSNLCTAMVTLLLVGGCLYAFLQGSDFMLISKSEYKSATEMKEKYEKLYQIQQQVEDSFLWEVNEEEQMTALYKEIIDALGDKYSYYMTEEEYEEWSNMVTGTFTGIGIAFTEDDNGSFVVNRVMENSPAEAAGMKAGDILKKVDGKTYNDANQVAAAVRGEEGTTVKITFQQGKKTKTAEIVRAEVKELSVYSSVVDKDYGYIQITSFEEETAKQFETELADLEQKGVKGLVIDLRYNPGGMMDQCIEVADTLLPECMITYTEDRTGKKETYNSDEHCTQLPYVVLINENSASAAEIVAAAIKDNNGGKLVGTKTFGKGIIQGNFELGDGSAMSLTIMQYFSPNGKKIHKKGVEPDYEVKLPETAKTDLQLEKALKLLK